MALVKVAPGFRCWLRLNAFFAGFAVLSPARGAPPAAKPAEERARTADAKPKPAEEKAPAVDAKTNAKHEAPTAPAKKPALHGAPPAAPRPVTVTPVAGKAEVEALREEVQALRSELRHAVGSPAPQPDPERARLEAELAESKKRLAAINAAIEGGLERAAVEDSIRGIEAHIRELTSALEQLPPPNPPEATPSLYEVSVKVQQLETDAGAREQAAAATVTAAATPTPAKPLIATPPPETGGGELMKSMGLLPLEFTAFGDFLYRFDRPRTDDYHVGAVELDASLKLTPFVNVSTAIAYTGEADAFGLGAFVIDCGLVGEGDGYPLKHPRISKSGVSFGRFDVPFGIAYLQYPATENRLVTLPQAVQLTHAAWNDVGAQGYAVGEHWTAVGYVVNGPAHPIQDGLAAPSRSAVGGRLSGKIDDLLEVGASGSLDFAKEGPVMLLAGGDLQATLGPLDVRGEYLLRHVRTVGLPELTHGTYGQAVLKVEPAFLVARFDAVLEGAHPLDRRVAGGGGVEVFPQGEVRAVYEQSLDTEVRLVTLQLVGGSSFQPTGLRR